MTDDQKVTHPEVAHLEPAAQASPAATPSQVRPALGRPARRVSRLPPPKILAAAALVVAALELLVWQVGGVVWGGVVHGVLLILAGVGLLVWSRWRNRRDARMFRAAGVSRGRAGVAAGRGPGGGSRVARLLGRGRVGSGAAGGRAGGSAGRGLWGRLTSGRRAASAGARAGHGVGRSGGLLGRLGRAASSTGKTGRAGGFLSRPGRAAGTGRTASAGTTGRRAKLRSALGRIGGGGRALASRTRAGGNTQRKNTTAATGGLAQKMRRRALAAFTRGTSEGTQPKLSAKTPTPEPKHTTEHAPKTEAVQEKPQPPTRDELVREAVEKVADATPAPVTSRRSKGTAVGSMRDILAAAEDLAAQLKGYDEEDMHVFVRELPQLGEALSAVEGGIRMMASRAESEWPLAAPVVEALGSVASDVKAAAGTVGEAKTAVHRENETDIERGEAPRQGERRWNV